ncbi:hypothetical protein EO92_06450 [Methanosarcina sp. 2.H.A.1B.4]|nr:hypothetical protein EO92_06450 [Methanosarcina sp. 2.H.A.1B.4]
MIILQLCKTSNKICEDIYCILLKSLWKKQSLALNELVSKSRLFMFLSKADFPFDLMILISLLRKIGMEGLEVVLKQAQYITKTDL